MVILTRVNVGGVNNFAAGPLYGVTILFIHCCPSWEPHQGSVKWHPSFQPCNKWKFICRCHNNVKTTKNDPVKLESLLTISFWVAGFTVLPRLLNGYTMTLGISWVDVPFLGPICILWCRRCRRWSRWRRDCLHIFRGIPFYLRRIFNVPLCALFNPHRIGGYSGQVFHFALFIACWTYLRGGVNFIKLLKMETLRGG